MSMRLDKRGLQDLWDNGHTDNYAQNISFPILVEYFVIVRKWMREVRHCTACIAGWMRRWRQRQALSLAVDLSVATERARAKAEEAKEEIIDGDRLSRSPQSSSASHI